MIRRTLATLCLTLLASCSIASAQTQSGGSSGGQTERLTDPLMSTYSRNYQYRSRTAPQPAPVDPDAEYGFRNPGGVGRMREYYPPGNTFERGTDPVKVANFGGGPAATSRQSQMQAQMVGNATTQTLFNHMDSYSRPLGWGYGFGFGGYGARFPY